MKEELENKISYSINLEDVVSLDAKYKDSFIQKLNELYDNPRGKFVEYENIKLKNLKKIIKNHLDLNLDLPIVMKVGKLRKVMSKGEDIKNQHELSAENIFMALNNLNNPPIITQSKSKPNNLTIFSTVRNKNNETIVVGFSFDYSFKSKKERVIVNKIDTIFGIDIDNEQGYYNNLANANRRVIYEKRRGWLAPIAPTSSSFNNSIVQNVEIDNKK